MTDSNQGSGGPRLRREPVQALATGSQVSIGEEEPLRMCVERALRTYFEHLDGETPTDLYALVVEEMEVPLLQIVMRQVCGNQSRAAAMLGISRGTLRKKLKQYDLL